MSRPFRQAVPRYRRGLPWWQLAAWGASEWCERQWSRPWVQWAVCGGAAVGLFVALAGAL